MWQDEIPDNLPRQRIHQDVVREGTRRRRQRRSLQGLVAALVLLLAAAPAVLLDGRRDGNTTLVAGPASQTDEVPTSVTPSNGPTTEVERSAPEVDEPAKAQRKPSTPPTTAATRSPQPGAGGSDPTAVATPLALASCDRALVPRTDGLGAHHRRQPVRRRGTSPLHPDPHEPVVASVQLAQQLPVPDGPQCLHRDRQRVGCRGRDLAGGLLPALHPARPCPW